MNFATQCAQKKEPEEQKYQWVPISMIFECFFFRSTIILIKSGNRKKVRLIEYLNMGQKVLPVPYNMLLPFGLLVDLLTFRERFISISTVLDVFFLFLCCHAKNKPNERRHKSFGRPSVTWREPHKIRSMLIKNVFKNNINRVISEHLAICECWVWCICCVSASDEHCAWAGRVSASSSLMIVTRVANVWWCVRARARLTLIAEKPDEAIWYRFWF